MNPQGDQYFEDGCGRCPLGKTPDCKAVQWRQVMEALRGIILDFDLAEEIKWKVPCYTFRKTNLLILSAFKEYAFVSFFKGSLLKDPGNQLERPGANTQAVRLLKFTSLDSVHQQEPLLKDFILQAIEIEKSAKKVEFKVENKPKMTVEFQVKLNEDPTLKAAFEALTPGRKRSYQIHFSQAKQAKTRESRIEKCIPKILAGKGFFD